MDLILKHLPRPLLDDLVEGRWLPFVGAGLSRNAVVPHGLAPLDWNGLGQSLAREMDGADDSTPAMESISMYAHAYGRSELIDRVRVLVRADDAQPGRVHRALARIGFDEIVTTNFDFLLEDAFTGEGKHCQLVVNEDQLVVRQTRAGTRLIKLHGDLNHPNRMVVTEDDYDAFLGSRPLLATAVAAHLISRTTVLLGYSLADPDTRQLLGVIRDRLGQSSRTIWAIQVAPKPH